MNCLLCKAPMTQVDKKFLGNASLCRSCNKLNSRFDSLAKRNREAAYNWAMEKALDLAGDITGVEPGSAMLEIEEGELNLRTVKKVHTQVARSVPPELQKDDRQNEEE